MAGPSRLSRMLNFSAVLSGALLLSSCAYWPGSGANGLIYTNVTKPVTVLKSDATTVRTGEACAIGLLGLFASGDSSVTRAKENVGITEITMVEERYRHYLLGAFSQYCVIVSGT